jgi:glycosyltransferase involved in cell wall biosynthesis
MKILYLVGNKERATGAKTYQDIVISEMSRRHEVCVSDQRNELYNNWDIVHVPDIKRVPSWITTASAPVLIDIHDYYWTKFFYFPCLDFPLRYILQRIRKPKYQKIIRSVAGVITHCEFVKDLIVHDHKFLVNIGIDDCTADTSELKKGNIIVFSGGDYFRKGITTLFKAVKILYKTRQDFKVIVAGKEPMYSYLFARALSKGLPIEFWPNGLPRNQLLELYKKAKVVCLPSWIEASPITITEALASGTRVVASDVGGIPEVIDQNPNGHLIKPGDHKALAREIDTCLNRVDKNPVNQLDIRFKTDFMITGLERIYMSFVKKS